MDYFDEKLPLRVPHECLFTYEECFAQVEPALRVHKFVLLAGGIRDESMVVCYRTRCSDELKAVWRQKAVDKATAARLLAALCDIRVPLDCKERSWSSMHVNRLLTIEHRGLPSNSGGIHATALSVTRWPRCAKPLTRWLMASRVRLKTRNCCSNVRTERCELSQTRNPPMHQTDQG